MSVDLLEHHSHISGTATHGSSTSETARAPEVRLDTTTGLLWANPPNAITTGSGSRTGLVLTSTAPSLLNMLDLYLSIRETLDVMNDPEEVAAFEEGVAAADRGDVLNWEQAKAELGW